MQETADPRRVERFDAITEDPGEIDELTRQMFGTSVRVERSDGRAPSLRLAQAATTRFGVQRVTWNVDGRCDVAPLDRFLCIRLHRGAYGLDQGHGQQLYTAGDTFLADPNRRVDAEVVGADLDSFTIERPLLENIAAQITPHRGRLNFDRTIPVTPQLGLAWNSVLDDVAVALRQSDLVADNDLIRAGLLYRLVATACAAFDLLEQPDDRSGSARAVRRAVAYIDEHLTDPITVGDIAEEVGLSVRALHSAFQRVLSTTPHIYLQRARLLAARRDLLNVDEDSSVASIARRWGFGHLGRFAAAYRREFNELPSQTLHD